MDIKVIRWKLNELMARKRIRNKDLAAALGITENSVYRLRRIDEMPRLSPERLNGICAVLKCQPGELLEWVSDDDGNQEAVAHPNSPLPNQEQKSVGTQSSKDRKPTNSFLTVIPEVPESA
jgi:putative transcriptional regulator